MNFLFWGIAFLSLRLSIALNGVAIDVMPDFIGFYLMMRGMKRFSAESQKFETGRKMSLVMLVISLVLTVFGFVPLPGEHVSEMVNGIVIPLILMVLSLVLQFEMIGGLQEMEGIHDWDLKADRLKKMWLVQVVLTPIGYLLAWIPAVGTLCLLASEIVSICFLGAMYSTKNRYYDYLI